ncbi:GGDEF domain-containing protein [Novipirellula artificiosorum]|uniref:diguanylate cyclase n=1 Tax=Novipirellula artificiosorum TaxID=2528016 RepID=A0A5C6DX82_9BACT|nr:GGDEF domain-containing protein [Novipirellula artificiosorum]TWU42043.1 Response regulator PleD [Novipirellula artificiosorum]
MTSLQDFNSPLTGPAQVVPCYDGEENDATLQQSTGDFLAEATTQESCLVQIYPPDVVDGMVLIEEDLLEIGRDSDVDIVLPDSSVSRRHAEIRREGAGYFVRDLGSTNGTLVNEHAVTERRLCSGDTIRIGSFLFKFLSAGSIESQYHETVYGALTRDALTGTLNKRYLIESMQREIARSNRQQLSLCVLMLDIDHFKSVNDTYGHLAGDEVLREFGGRVSSVCREDDMLARYGGEEFCLMLCGTDCKEGRIMAERCRAIIADTPFATSVGPLPITASFGLACLNASILTPNALLEQADQCLYDAKRGGRNRVCG